MPMHQYTDYSFGASRGNAALAGLLSIATQKFVSFVPTTLVPGLQPVTGELLEYTTVALRLFFVVAFARQVVSRNDDKHGCRSSGTGLRRVLDSVLYGSVQFGR